MAKVLNEKDLLRLLNKLRASGNDYICPVCEYTDNQSPCHCDNDE